MAILLMYVLYFEYPGWYRVITPARYGLSEIAPRVYTDDVAQSDRILKLVKAGEETSARFFGKTGAAPRYVFCTTEKCVEDFGIQALGEAVLRHVVLIEPNGMQETIVAHERAHIDLHTYFNLKDLYHRRFPTWFDEGLASFVSEPKRIRFNVPDFDLAVLRRIESTGDWERWVRGKTWAQTYGTARAAVAHIERKLGYEGLQKFVASVTNRGDFDQKLDQILTGDRLITSQIDQ